MKDIEPKDLPHISTIMSLAVLKNFALVDSNTSNIINNNGNNNNNK